MYIYIRASPQCKWFIRAQVHKPHLRLYITNVYPPPPAYSVIGPVGKRMGSEVRMRQASESDSYATFFSLRNYNVTSKTKDTYLCGIYIHTVECVYLQCRGYSDLSLLCPG